MTSRRRRLLKAPEFEPKPTDFVTDAWGQKCAHFLFKDVKPGEDVQAVMKVEAEVRAVRWFVDPDGVGRLEDIPADIKKAYTQDASKLVMTDPVIQKAVKEAVGDEKNPYWMARKINKYVQDKMHYEMAGGWNIAPVVLSRGSGSCSEYTFVMLAMCHAAGLPARYQGSVVIRGDDASRDVDFHRWVEVYLPNYGWVPVDPSGGDSPVPIEQAAVLRRPRKPLPHHDRRRGRLQVPRLGLQQRRDVGRPRAASSSCSARPGSGSPWARSSSPSSAENLAD